MHSHPTNARKNTGKCFSFGADSSSNGNAEHPAQGSKQQNIHVSMKTNAFIITIDELDLSVVDYLRAVRRGDRRSLFDI